MHQIMARESTVVDVSCWPQIMARESTVVDVSCWPQIMSHESTVVDVSCWPQIMARGTSGRTSKTYPRCDVFIPKVNRTCGALSTHGRRAYMYI
jgi:tRNA A37 threonylcarbamoyladenosine synthetase subunit TsaC/SUA5/YrdC